MGYVGSKIRSPGQILGNSFLNITSDLDPQVSPVVYKAMKKGNSYKSSLSGEHSRALWALLFLYCFMNTIEKKLARFLTRFSTKILVIRLANGGRAGVS